MCSKETPRYNGHRDCDSDCDSCKHTAGTATTAFGTSRAPHRRWSRRRRFSRLIRSFRVFAKVFFCLRIDSTRPRLTRSALVFPLCPSTVAVLTPTVQRSVIFLHRWSRVLAGPETHKASQSLAAGHLRPQGNDLPRAITHIACEFTLCLLTVRLGDCQQGLVCLVYLLEPLFSFGIFVNVGVVLEGQSAERPPDLLIGGVLLHAQNFVVDTHRVWATSSLTPTFPVVGVASWIPTPEHSQPRPRPPPSWSSRPDQASDSDPLPGRSAQPRRWRTLPLPRQ